VLDLETVEPLRLAGSVNFLFLGGVVASVALSAMFNSWFHDSSISANFKNNVWFSGGSPFREVIMVVMVLLSLAFTSKALHEENKFTYGPILEVAILFVGIFLAMVPALQMLQAHGDQLGIDNPWKFFWITGTLSSFLDNAPTYLVFFQVAQTSGGELTAFGKFVADTGIPHEILVAISLGAVFMGANTYIGNGPNFMVKAVAEEVGIKMPSFFGYMRYSVGILVPIFVVVTFIFLL